MILKPILHLRIYPSWLILPGSLAPRDDLLAGDLLSMDLLRLDVRQSLSDPSLRQICFLGEFPLSKALLAFDVNEVDLVLIDLLPGALQPMDSSSIDLLRSAGARED